ncbi:pre-rRNA processing protein [Chamberlinius hualienensis]
MALKNRVARKAAKRHGKGNRWLKGQSSSSNPTTNKHREAAKRGFFATATDSKSTLTTDALLKHNELQADEEDLCLHSKALSISDGGESDVAKSLASNLTNCSNPAFEKFLSKWQPNAEFDKNRLAVIAAVAEVIKQKNGKETDTEYFASLLTTLSTLEDVDLLAAVVSLLSMVIKRVPSSVLKLKFSESTKLFEELLIKHIESENTNLLRGLIGCLMVVLRVQDIATWHHSSTEQTYNNILALSLHSKPGLRKTAQHAVGCILKGSSFMLEEKRPVTHPAAIHTAKFCIAQLKSDGAAASSTTLHTLGLLKNVMCTFSSRDIRSISEHIFGLMNVNNSVVKKSVLETLHGLFISRPSSDKLSKHVNGQIINVLYEFEPSSTDAQQLLAWITVLKEAHMNLLKLDDQLCLDHIACYFTKLCRLWPSPKKEVYSSITATLKSILYSLDGSLIRQIGTQLETNGDLVASAQKIIDSFEKCLSFQHNEIWPCVFQVLAVVFEVLGKVCHPLMKKCLRSLADLRSSPLFQYTSELDYTFGKAVKTFGPRVIMEIIPLSLIQDGTNFEHSWLIPVLRDNVQETELSYFKEYFLPLIGKCQTKIQNFKSDENKVMLKTYELLYYQLWSLFPGFCTLPTDLAESFKSIAKKLGEILTGTHGDYKLHVLAAIRILINKNLDNELNKTELAKYAKNYLPIFFNLYGTEPGTDEQNYEGFRLAVFDTIKVYLQIANPDICQSLFSNGLKLFDSKTDSFSRNAMLDLLRAMLPYLKEDLINKLFETCVPLLESKDRTTQKKVYRIFEELCMGKSETCRDFVKWHLESLKNILASSLSSVVPSAQGPRLRCLNHIVLQLNKEDLKFIYSIIPEIIYCLKENAKKVRQAAGNLIVTIGETFIKFGEKSEEDVIKDYIGLLLAGEALSTHFICSTIIAVGHVVSYFKEHVSSSMIKLLLENLSTFGSIKTTTTGKNTSREIISSVLDFIKAMIGCFNDRMVISHVKTITDILANLNKDCQLHFRIKIRRIFQRLVRKLGYELVKSVVPETYQKLLTYIRKQELRIKKKQDMENGEDDDDDEASTGFQAKTQSIDDILKDSSSEDETEMKSVKSNKTKKTSTWLQEHAETEIVDFLDPKASRNILASKPETSLKTKKVKNDFKIGPDNRMIIVDEDQDETKGDKLSVIDELSDKKKRKRTDDDGSGDELIDTKSVASKGSNFGKTKSRKNFNYGSEYKAKKAGGDIKKDGKHDPYAYVPLEFQSLNKRKKAKLAGKFNNIVRSARQGAARGKQARSKNRKSKN